LGWLTPAEFASSAGATPADECGSSRSGRGKNRGTIMDPSRPGRHGHRPQHAALPPSGVHPLLNAIDAAMPDDKSGTLHYSTDKRMIRACCTWLSLQLRLLVIAPRRVGSAALTMTHTSCSIDGNSHDYTCL